MKTFIQLFIIFIVFASCNSAEKIEGPVTAITHVTTIDAVTGKNDNQTVVIRDNKIFKVADTGSLAFDDSATIINGQGKFLIPGLWDAHVHLTFIDGFAPAMFDLFLAYGVTSVRDTGGKLDSVLYWKSAANQLGDRAPNVKIAGPLLDGIPTVYNGSAPTRPPLGVGALTSAEAGELVDQFSDAGVDLIKSYEMLSPEAFKEVVKRAHSHGLVVTGHVPLSMDVIEATEAGMNSMEHMRNLEMSCTASYDSLLDVRIKMLAAGSNDEGGILRSNIHNAQRGFAIANQDSARTDLVLSALAENDTWQIPTLTIVAARLNRLYADPSWVDNFKILPEAIKNEWENSARVYTEQTEGDDPDAYGLWGLEMIQKLKDHKINIMAGTDTPIFFLTPGESLHKELELLVQGGLTSMEALEAATLKPAQYFKIENSYGSIESGKIADLVLLDANPLDDISNTININSVVRSGKVYDRKALDEFLDHSTKR